MQIEPIGEFDTGYTLYQPGHTITDGHGNVYEVTAASRYNSQLDTHFTPVKLAPGCIERRDRHD